MKIRYIIAIVFIVISAIHFMINPSEDFGSTSLKVITRGESTNEVNYIAIDSNGNSREINKFVSDELKIYNASSRCFSSYIENNKVRNKLIEIEFDDIDDSLKTDEIVRDICMSAERLEHAIWEFQIFKLADDYFALIKLNVNWHSPCDLYQYDINEKELKLLYSFDSVDIIGLAYPKE